MSASARERIYAAALDLFLEKGYAATATREICRRARVTKPVLYYYFGNKERLYRELILEACGTLLQELEEAANGGEGARQKLINVLAEDFRHTRIHPRLAALFFRMIFTARQEGPRIDYVELGMRWLRLLARIARQGVRSGELTGNPNRIAEAILGLHTIYTMGFLLRGRPALSRRLARRIVDSVCSGDFGENRRGAGNV